MSNWPPACSRRPVAGAWRLGVGRENRVVGGGGGLLGWRDGGGAPLGCVGGRPRGDLGAADLSRGTGRCRGVLGIQRSG